MKKINTLDALCDAMTMTEIIIMHWRTTTYIISSDDSLKCRERWMEVTDDKSFGWIFTSLLKAIIIVNINV